MARVSATFEMTLPTKPKRATMVKLTSSLWPATQTEYPQEASTGVNWQVTIEPSPYFINIVQFRVSAPLDIITVMSPFRVILTGLE
jgi:hypothetical protein